MKLNDFDYYLPPELIAQEPAPQRHLSRLLALERKTGKIIHKKFSDLLEFLTLTDLLVMNKTRVLPARLFGKKAGSGGKVEILLLRKLEDDLWEALANPGRRIKEGHRIIFEEDSFEAEVVDRTRAGTRILKFYSDKDFWQNLERLGNVPLPPYIHKPVSDSERYQTVYSEDLGSVAAPTAGLHFTHELLKAIKAKGVHTAFITLDIGIGTFRPVKTENIEDHEMEEEYFKISRTSADEINKAKKSGKRIIAVGTTSARTLESAAGDEGLLSEREGWTKLFVYPSYKFKIVDAIITNFHLPKSTLLMLVSAFAGRELILKAYEEAIRERYRFYSFGDAMFIY